jgi:hypothetical protein
MILKGNQRAGGSQLAAHLLKTEDNEHVHVHELRGFMSDDLKSAFHEAYAVSRGTRAKQYLFSLSLNPPSNEQVPVDTFEAAIEKTEQKLGLDGQPRAIVFHEKEGRRHAHVVWSRIDVENMKAINLPHYKLKLRDMSRELYLENGWQMPRGLVNSKERDPTNFTHSQWEQVKRAGHDPRALKSMFQDCWAASDSRQAFAAAIQARGYTLARGDRRGYVAVDYRGEVYAIAKYTGIKTREVRDRLGDEKELASIEQAKSAISARMTGMLRRNIQEIETRHRLQSASFAFRKNQIVQRQRDERVQLEKNLAARWEKETLKRTQRLSTGFKGIWDRLTGQYAETRRQNEFEALKAVQRDRMEKDTLIFRHLEERQFLHRQRALARQENTKQVEALHQDIASYMKMAGREPPELKSHFQATGSERSRGARTREHDLEREI